MNDIEFEEQVKIRKDIDARYHEYINGLILFRFKLIVSIGIFFHLGFCGIDKLAYPAYASTFLKIRLFSDVFLVILILVSFSKKIRSHIVWLADAAPTILILTLCVMVFITDGTSNRYYEGANLVFLGISIINPFYIGHLISCLLIWIVMYEVSMLCNHTEFNLVNFTFANYFMISTAFFVVLLAKFYKDQHYKAFVQQEQLKLNEKTLAALFNQADKLSKTDELTKIHNRRSFFEMLDSKIEASERSNQSFYLIIFDVDHFKELNDRWGHPFGDLALTKVIEVVQNNIRPLDCLGRFGGDEFILFLDITDPDMLMRRLTKISQGVTSLNLKQENQTVLISVSIGAAKFVPQQNMNRNQLLEKADQQLLMIKKTNRGQIGIAE